MNRLLNSDLGGELLFTSSIYRPLRHGSIIPGVLSPALAYSDAITFTWSLYVRIGTHALLFKEDLPEASLVMVDEQHRFGTKQRASLEALVSAGERKPHFLQFSATPIPRTQAMMESELLDVSLITTTPFEREVLTQTIGKQDFPHLLTHIKDEISHM